MNGVWMSGCPGRPPRRRSRCKRLTSSLPSAIQRAQRGRVVALRRKVGVGAGVAAVRIHELFGPQPRDQIHRAEARSDMAGASLHDHVKTVQATDVGEERRPFDWIGRRAANRGDGLGRRVTSSLRRRAVGRNDLFRPSACFQRRHRAVQPPSTTSVAPVMYAEARDARNTRAPL